MQRAVSRAERTVTAAGLGLAVVAFVSLGVLWQLDRTRRWEAPRWPEPGFVALRAGAPAATDSAGGAPETWVVAVNLGCPHCLASLRLTAASREARRAPARIAALLVDTREAPAEGEWRALPCDQVWWDEAQRWRRRWGHRVYGEVLCFAPDGRLLRTLPPAAEPDAAENATAPGNAGRDDRR